MPSLVDARAFNAAYHASTRPVAVFVGGTSGIGEHMARRLCSHLHGDLDVVLVGRNHAAAQRILGALPAAPSGTPKPLREFMHCDATLMADVRKTAEELKAKLGKINFLVLSAGVLNLNGREETTEGLDKKLALSYYSRWKFIHDLAPLLERASAAGEDAKTITVLAAGKGGQINTDDLGLSKTYNLTRFMSEGTSYTDCMVQSFASAHPTVAFTHIFPGSVRTPNFHGTASGSGWALRAMSPLLWLVGQVSAVAPEDAAEWMLYGLLRGKAGAYMRDNHGDDIAPSKFTGEEVRKAVWDHTVKVTGSA